ncbi:MAG: hypothetical protein Ta2G_13200 [Termitinemataceae bacterium]|nr:MAG: hypothetical protein Ta2G_13200 [Termitinemataceae bacterium]
MNSIAVLAVLSGLTLNLILQFGLGVSNMHSAFKNNIKTFSLGYLNLFITNCVLWFFWTYVLSPLSISFVEYFLLFPLVAILFSFIEILFRKLFFKKDDANGRSSESFQSTSYFGLGIASLLITLRMASTASDLFVLSFFFCLGSYAVVLLLNAIKQRTQNERVSAKFRGMPLLLISCALLSILCSSIAFVLLSR